MPRALLEQLAPSGRLVILTGSRHAEHLMVMDKDDAGRLHQRRKLPAAFVPLTGKEGC